MVKQDKKTGEEVGVDAKTKQPTEEGGLRDRALIGVMIFSFARVSAVVGMEVGDYFQQGKRYFFRLHEKGGKHHVVPTHHKAEEYLDARLAAAGIAQEKHTPPLS